MPVNADVSRALEHQSTFDNDDEDEEPQNTLKKHGLTFFAFREFAWRRPLYSHPHHFYLLLFSMELWMLIMFVNDLFNLLTLSIMYYNYYNGVLMVLD